MSRSKANTSARKPSAPKPRRRPAAPPTLEQLRTRVEALGLELLVDDPKYTAPDEPDYYLLDPEKRTVVDVASNLNALETVCLSHEHFKVGEAAATGGKANGAAPDLAALELRIAEDVGDALRTIETNAVHEQPGSAEHLPRIATLARDLSTALNDLCGTEHLRELAAPVAASNGEQPAESDDDELLRGLYGLAGVIDALAERFVEHGSLGATKGRRGHDLALVNLAEREVARAVALAEGAS